MKVLSVHWGFSLGGVAKYAAAIESVREYLPLTLRSLCLLPSGRFVDERALESLDAVIINVQSVFNPTWIRAARRHIAAEAPDCILSHGFNGHLVSLIAGSAFSRVPRRLATYHGSYHATTGMRRLAEPVYNAFTHWFLRTRVTSILTVAQYCADYLVMHGVQADKLTVVHNGIPEFRPDLTARKSIRDEWGIGHEHILIGAASRLDPVKGLKYLLNAFSAVACRHPNAQLVIIGDGVMRESLEMQSKELGIGERVLFAGMRSDVPRCLMALDLFVLPSLAEYHSIALLEAMRAGLPIVATDVGGNIESIHNYREGLITAPGDTESMVSALELALNDPMLRERLAKAARQRFIKEFTEELMLKKTAGWFQDACRK